MSLAIDTDRVTAVLLADGWHDVVDKSFNLDAYEFMWDGRLVGSGSSATGYDFEEGNGSRLAGPLTAIIAVRYTKG